MTERRDAPEAGRASGNGLAAGNGNVADRSHGASDSVVPPSLRSVADLLAAGVIVGNTDGTAAFANRAWMAMTGQDDLEWVGHGWLRVLPARQHDAERVALLTAVMRGETSERLWQIVHSDGSLRSLAVSIAPQTLGGAAVGFVATVSDMTAHEMAASELNHQATHDPLTGLLNRAQVSVLLRHALDRGRREPDAIAAVLFIDVDGLKATNDRYGHQAGDRLLQALAHRIRHAVRPVDIVARYGGDEFVVLCEGLPDRHEATVIAQRVIDGASVPSGVGGPIGVSIGIAFADDPGTPPEQLLGAADLAMYQAKQRGRSFHVGSTNPARSDGSPRGGPRLPRSARRR